MGSGGRRVQRGDRLVRRRHDLHRRRVDRLQRHPAAPALLLHLDRPHQADRLHAGGEVAEQEQQAIVRLEVAGSARDPQFAEAGDVVERDVLRPGQSRLQCVPFVARIQRLGGLERLHLLARCGHRLRACAGNNRHRRRILLHRVGEVHAGGDAGAQAVVEQPRQLQNRAAFGGGAQVAFVGDAFGVEAQHVGADRPRIEQRHRRIVLLARAQPGQRRQCGIAQVGLHGGAEVGIGADAIREAVEPRPVGQRQRRAGGRAATAGAGVFATGATAAHRPPPILKLMLPWSG